MEIKNYFAQDAQGNIMPSANCYLYLPGTTTLATGLVDGNGVPISNPFLASSIGQVTFGAPNGVYDLRISQGARDTTIEIQCADLLQALDETASFLGAKSSAPTTRNDGSALQIADRYFNTADQLEYLYKSTGWVANNLDGQLLATSQGASLLGAVMQDGSSGTVQQAIEIGDISLRQDLAGPSGDRRVGRSRNKLADTLNSVGKALDTTPITPWEFSHLVTSKPVASDPATWDWKPAFIAMFDAMVSMEVKNVFLFGTFRIVGGIDPTAYIWADLTIFSAGATIILDTPTGDNGVFQVGSNLTIVGHLNGEATGEGNGNGFVRNVMCIGNWWNSIEVSDVNIESLHLTGMPDNTAMAIAGNTHGVRIGRLEMGAGQLGLMVHWAGLPNNTDPTSTFHPHDIHIGSLVGEGFTESLITESACYDIRIDYINGKNNYRDFMHIGGDFGETLAIARDKGRVCRGNSIGRLETSGSKHRAIDYNASAGKVAGIMEGEFSADSIKAIGTGLVNSVGLRFENRAAGRIDFADVSGFANNISFLNSGGADDGELRSSLATGQGIIYSNTSHAKASIWRTTNDNQAAGGGVGGVNVNATCSDIEVGLLRASTNNAATHGCTLASGSSNIRIRNANGAVDSTRVLVVDNAPFNTNRVGPCILDSGAISYSGPDPTVSASARGHSMSWGAASPTTGSSKRGDISLSTNASAGGKAGTICTTGGVNGSTSVHKAWGVIDT